MSRPYRIRVAETVRHHVVVEDGVECGLDLLALLPAEEQRVLLTEELIGRGFVVTGTSARRESELGVVVEVDLERNRVRVSKRSEREVEKTVTRVFASDNKEPSDEERAEVRVSAEQEIAREGEILRRALSDDLESVLRDLGDELSAITIKVTQEALRRKASRMGEVESIEEDPATGSLTIRVRV